jgi:hypothetical protein
MEEKQSKTVNMTGKEVKKEENKKENNTIWQWRQVRNIVVRQLIRQ